MVILGIFFEAFTSAILPTVEEQTVGSDFLGGDGFGFSDISPRHK